jgi:DNA (cytosine-5)-methyltransferase 1
MNKLRVAEVFAGIGGVTGGFLDAGGYEAVFLNDNDPAARDTFVHNFPKLKNSYHVRSVRTLSGPDLLELAGGQVDGLLGCPPCQGLSAAGPRNEHDQRNELLHEMHRLIWSIRPRFFVIENVPRLLHTELYKDFESSLSRHYELLGVVLNAAEFGIPQLRCRAVVIGFRKDLGLRPSMPSPTHGGSGRVFAYPTGGFIAPEGPTGRRVFKLRRDVSLPNRPLVTLRQALSDLPTNIPPDEEEPREYARSPMSAYQQQMRWGAQYLWNHRAWDHGPAMIKLLGGVKPGDCPKTYGGRARNTTYFSQAYARLHSDGLARTITTNFHNPGSGRFTHYAAPRTLTIREALRIQGFPDTFHFDGVGSSVAERLVGNAFPRLLAQAIADHIMSLVTH